MKNQATVSGKFLVFSSVLISIFLISLVLGAHQVKLSLSGATLDNFNEDVAFIFNFSVNNTIIQIQQD